MTGNRLHLCQMRGFYKVYLGWYSFFEGGQWLKFLKALQQKNRLPFQ